MSEKNANESPADEWQAERLRFTLFLCEGEEIPEAGWWEQLTGNEPEKRISFPRLKGYQEEGAFARGKLTLSVKLDRVDWLFEPLSAGEEEIETVATLGSLADAMDVFVKLVSHWPELPSCPMVKRMALGAVALLSVPDRISGYKKIAPYIKSVELDAEGSSDLLYQINRPRSTKTSIEDLRINRLSKWAVGLRRSVAVAVTPESIERLPGDERFTCRLELDINTSADFGGRLSHNDQSNVFAELVELAQEIAERGDVK